MNTFEKLGLVFFQISLAGLILMKVSPNGQSPNIYFFMGLVGMVLFIPNWKRN